MQCPEAMHILERKAYLKQLGKVSLSGKLGNDSQETEVVMHFRMCKLVWQASIARREGKLAISL